MTGRRRFPAPTVRALIVTGFGLLLVILVGVVAGSAWMAREHQAAVSEMEQHSATASLLQDTRSEAGNAALLLQRYLMANDATLIPEIRDSTALAVQDLNEASADLQARGDDPQGPVVAQVAAGGQSLGQAVDAIISLRQSGDVARAAALLELIVPRFRSYRLQLGDAAHAEMQDVSAHKADADRAGNWAFWLLVGSGIGGGIIALAAAWAVARAILRPLTRLERTARAIGDGDLEARTEPSGPRELAHLGETLNTMAAQLDERERDLRRSNKELKERENQLRLSNAELKERNRQLMEARMMAATDGLTSLPNHRSFHEAIRREVSTIEETGGNIGVIMLDIDGFKQVNDTLGHLEGDEILRDCAGTFCKVVQRDWIYRYGGDEFAVLLPGADLPQTAAVAEQLRHAIAQREDAGIRKVTISLGVASFPETARSAEELIYEADAAMYWAKSAGKDRVGRWDATDPRRDGDMPQATRPAAARRR